MGLHTENQSCNFCRLENRYIFCKVDVVVWQHLMHYDKEKVLVSTEILFGGYCGGLRLF